VSWVVLDDQFHSHPKILAVGLAATGLYARALSYCGAHLTDGFVPKEWVRSASMGRADLVGRLLSKGLFLEAEGGYQVKDYLLYNPPKTAVLEKRSEIAAKRAKAGRKGAQARWQTDSTEDGKAMANGMANAKQNDGPTPIPTPTPLTEGSTVSDYPTHPVVPEEGGWESEQEEHHELVPPLRDFPEPDPWDEP
jgi:hypothetical protein